MGWLVAYDIGCEKRWRKVYKNVGELGYRLQYSLFWLPCDMQTGHNLADYLETIVNIKEDDVRFYPFPDNAWARFYGVPPWSEGVIDPLYMRFSDCWRERPPKV